jgi:hypothetical protein
MGRSIPWRQIRRLPKDLLDPAAEDPVHSAHLAFLRQDVAGALAQLKPRVPRGALAVLRGRFGIGCYPLSFDDLARVLRLPVTRVRALYHFGLWRLASQCLGGGRRWYVFD